MIHDESPPSNPAMISSSPPATAGPEGLSPTRAWLQRPMLYLAAMGLLAAGWSLWSQRAEFMDLAGNGFAGPKQRRTQPASQSFDLSEALIPRDEIRPGGPSKDGIASLTAPKLVAPEAATFLKSTDRVIGVTINNDSRAYPLKILEWHEAVNDRIGGVPAAVTYCPLCDSAAIFDRRTDAGEVEFGVSGLLYNSNVLFYDRAKQGIESLWSQMMARGVSGPNAGKGLKALPVELTTWADWSRRHPKTRVLSTETGHGRRYGGSAYEDYFKSPMLMFPAEPSSDRLLAKAPVLGVWTKDSFRAYPLSAFAALDKPRELRQELGGLSFTVKWNPEAKSLIVAKADRRLSWMYGFWFAWYAFHPDTEVFDGAATKTGAMAGCSDKRKEQGKGKIPQKKAPVAEKKTPE